MINPKKQLLFIAAMGAIWIGTTIYERVNDRKRAAEREQRMAQTREEIEQALDAVTSLDEDRILRRLVNLIDAGLRTNFFQTGPDGHPRQTITFKFESGKVDGLPLPRQPAGIAYSGPSSRTASSVHPAIRSNSISWASVWSGVLTFGLFPLPGPALRPLGPPPA